MLGVRGLEHNELKAAGNVERKKPNQVDFSIYEQHTTKSILKLNAEDYDV